MPSVLFYFESLGLRWSKIIFITQALLLTISSLPHFFNSLISFNIISMVTLPMASLHKTVLIFIPDLFSLLMPKLCNQYLNLNSTLYLFI